MSVPLFSGVAPSNSGIAPLFSDKDNMQYLLNEIFIH